jgi:hypothetical protein
MFLGMSFYQLATLVVAVLIGVVMLLDFLKSRGVNVQQDISNALQNNSTTKPTNIKSINSAITTPEDGTAIQTMVADFQKVSHAFHFFTKEGGSTVAARQLLLDFVDRVAPPLEGNPAPSVQAKESKA